MHLNIGFIRLRLNNPSPDFSLDVGLCNPMHVFTRSTLVGRGQMVTIKQTAEADRVSKCMEDGRGSVRTRSGDTRDGTGRQLSWTNAVESASYRLRRRNQRKAMQ